MAEENQIKTSTTLCERPVFCPLCHQEHPVQAISTRKRANENRVVYIAWKFRCTLHEQTVERYMVYSDHFSYNAQRNELTQLPDWY